MVMCIKQDIFYKSIILGTPLPKLYTYKILIDNILASMNDILNDNRLASTY